MTNPTAPTQARMNGVHTPDRSMTRIRHAAYTVYPNPRSDVLPMQPARAMPSMSQAQAGNHQLLPATRAPIHPRQTAGQHYARTSYTPATMPSSYSYASPPNHQRLRASHYTRQTQASAPPLLSATRAPMNPVQASYQQFASVRYATYPMQQSSQQHTHPARFSSNVIPNTAQAQYDTTTPQRQLAAATMTSARPSTTSATVIPSSIHSADVTPTGSTPSTLSSVNTHQQAQRTEHTNPSDIAQKLNEEIAPWLNYSENRYPINITSLDDSEQHSIYDLLIRLGETPDFICRPKPLSNTICHMLADLSSGQHPQFKSLFFATLQDNLTACEDRMAMTVNLLYSCWKIHCDQSGKTLEQKLCTLAGLARTGVLRNEINRQLNEAFAQQRLTDEDLGESSEVHVYWEAQLKEKLGLVTAIEEYLYINYELNHHISQQKLEERVATDFLADMATNSLVQQLWERNTPRKLRQPLRAIKRKQTELDNESHRGNKSSQQYLAESKALQTKYENKKSKLIISWLKTHLPESELQRVRPQR